MCMSIYVCPCVYRVLTVVAWWCLCARHTPSSTHVCIHHICMHTRIHHGASVNWESEKERIMFIAHLKPLLQIICECLYMWTPVNSTYMWMPVHVNSTCMWMPVHVNSTYMWTPVYVNDCKLNLYVNDCKLILYVMDTHLKPFIVKLNLNVNWT
jgi:hypothetical protein